MDKFELLSERNRILQEISLLGEMRSATLSTRYQKCSSKNCHCKAKGDPGHGPIYAISYKDSTGKLRSVNLKAGKQLDRIRIQIDNYHKYKELSRSFVRVNNELCTIQEEESQEPEELKKTTRRNLLSCTKGSELNSPEIITDNGF